MNELHDYYKLFGLKPGASLKDVLEQHKFMSQTVHPDLIQFPKQKKLAEEKMKQYNHAKDILEQHLTSSEHCATGPCACRTVDSSSDLKAQKDKQDRFKKQKADEENARRRAAERAREEKEDRVKKQRAAEENARRRAEDRDKEKEAENIERAAKEKVDQETARLEALQQALEAQQMEESAKRRWTIFQLQLVAFVFLFFGTWAANHTYTNIDIEPEDTPEMSEQRKKVSLIEAEIDVRREALKENKRKEYLRQKGRIDGYTDDWFTRSLDAPEVPTTPFTQGLGADPANPVKVLSVDNFRRRLLQREKEQAEAEDERRKAEEARIRDALSAESNAIGYKYGQLQKLKAKLEQAQADLAQAETVMNESAQRARQDAHFTYDWKEAQQKVDRLRAYCSHLDGKIGQATLDLEQ